MDVLSVSQLFDYLPWYENDGSGGFTPHIVTRGVVDQSSGLFVVDVDGDGDADVLSGSFDFDNQTGTIFWHENDGSENFTEHTVTTTDWGNNLFAADMDGDGDMDVLSNKTAWYENDGSEGFTAPID